MKRMPKVLIDNSVMKEGYTIEDIYNTIWKLELEDSDGDISHKDNLGECIDIVRGVSITLANVMEKQITKIK